MSEPSKLSQLITRWQHDLQSEIDQDNSQPDLQKGIRALQELEESLSATPAVESSLGDVATMDSVSSIGDFSTHDGESPRVAQPTSSSGVQGYQIVRELGRGGMGVVYEAFQPDLKRTVALKMILAGGHASESQLQRFRIEAEAVARLKHPNIVQIYDIGEQQGLPYFSLEFCDGGAINDKLDGTPWQERDAAKLMETLARGMHAAHKAGVVHRDLKPHNVLLDGDGTPKITDFGLAKRLDEGEGMTKTESVMGTPSYMAPEQARGQTKEVGPSADVYSLGAMLYELLTGRPPFKAASAWDTIAQVINDEPVSPRELNPMVSKDLETICLKCLEKDPLKRYSSAETLAEDLLRFQKDEPIAARPVGRGEKAWRWCRRNPVVASLLAIVIVVLAAGAIVSSVLAVQANAARADASRDAASARRSERIAIRAKKDLEISVDDLLTGVARSLARPLGVGVTNSSSPLTVSEIRALNELAETPEEKVRIRFVQEALRNPLTTQGLRYRAESALLAAVQFDEGRRDRIESILIEQLESASTEEQRAEVALIMSRLSGLTPSARSRVIETLIDCMGVPQLSEQAAEVAEAVAHHVEQLPTNEAAHKLIQLLNKTTRTFELSRVLKGVGKVLSRMQEGQASLCRQTIHKVIELFQTDDSIFVGLRLREILHLLLPHIEAELIPKLAESFVGGLSRLSSVATLPDLVGGLILLKKKSDSPELRAIITRFCASLVSQAARLQDGTLAYAIGAVDTLLPHLNPAEVSEIREKITSRALQALGDNSCMPFAMGMISTDLVSIVSSMSPEEKARICSEAAGSILKKIRVASRKDQERLGRPLLTLLALIPSKDAMAIVTDGIQSTNNSSVVHLLSETLSNLARRAESGEASQACSPIVELCKQRMKRSTDRAIRDMCLAITALAPHMDQGQAVRLCRAYANGLTNALAKYPQPLARRRLAEAVSQLATRIPTVDAEQICSRGSMTLLRAIQSIHDAKSLHLHLQGLSNLVLRVKPRDAQRICSQASTRLLQVLKIEKKSNSIKELIDALRVIAPHLEALNAVPVAAAFTKALKSGRNSSSARSGLFVITERLPKKEAEEVALTLMDEFIKPSASIGYLRIPLEVVRPLSPDNLFRKVVLFIEGMSQTKRFDRFIATFTLLLTDARHSQITSRARSMASLLANPQSASNFLMIKRYLKPLSCRLTTQQLVDLLKMPTCIRDPKRIILSQLENRFGEKFHNHWDFVRYAKEKNLDLNFNSPPGKLATLETRP